MKERPKIDLGMTGYDELFMNDQERAENRLPKIYDITLSEIDDFPDHPFKVKDDEDMLQLVESVRERGIITPITLRQKEDGRYEIVSGHRRKRACEIAGLETIPAEIKELSRDEAIILPCSGQKEIGQGGNALMAPDEKVVVTLDDFEQRLLVSGLADFRNDLIRDEKPTEDVDDLILKVIDAPTQKEKRKADREARYFVLPSSIHEVLIMPDNGQMTPMELAKMVKEINDHEVSPQDLLCSRVLRFRTDTQELSVAADAERRREMER